MMKVFVVVIMKMNIDMLLVIFQDKMTLLIDVNVNHLSPITLMDIVVVKKLILTL